jgi:dihydrofolate reductase
MRKIIVGAFVSLDGVMQAPGGPDEDPTGGFKYGGWVAPLWDDVTGKAMDESFAKPYDLLLGRKTYDIFAAHWPYVKTDPKASDFDALNAQIAEQFNRVTKYVATHRPESLTWQNSRGLGTDVVATLRELKRQDGPALLTQGSTELVHTLFANDLVDEVRVLTYPLVLGRGKRLFDAQSKPAAFSLVHSQVSPNGVVIATYVRAGEVKTGSFALEEPTPAELERRRKLN